MFVRSSQQFAGIQPETVVQQDGAIGHVVDVRTHFIHTVSRSYRHHVVRLRFAENPECQVDGFVTAVAEEDLSGLHALDGSQHLFHLQLQRVGIAVVRGIIRILVRIEKDGSRRTLVFVTGRTVRLQRPDVRAHQFLQRFHAHFISVLMDFNLTVMALRCASRCSPAAMSSTAGPMARTPCGVSS